MLKKKKDIVKLMHAEHFALPSKMGLNLQLASNECSVIKKVKRRFLKGDTSCTTMSNVLQYCPRHPTLVLAHTSVDSCNLSSSSLPWKIQTPEVFDCLNTDVPPTTYHLKYIHA